MTFLIPWLLSLALGWFCHELILRRRPCSLFELGTAFLFGMALSVQLCFYQIYFFNQFNASYLICLHALALGILLALRGWFIKPAPAPSPIDAWPLWVYSLCFGFFIYIAWLCAINNPYGDWDAWAYWNFSAKQLALSGTHWKDIYTFSYNAKHPLFLPYWTIWQWACTGMTPYVPIYQTVLFFALLIMMLVDGLMAWTQRFFSSLIAGVLLCSIPLFLVYSIDQYAEVLFNLFVLSTVLLVMRLIKNADRPTLIWTCALIGFMTLVKNEAAFAGLVLLGFVFYFLRQRPADMLLSLGIFLLASIPAMMTKCWFQGGFQGVLFQIDPHLLLDWTRYCLVLNFYGGLWLQQMWGGIFLIPVGILLCRIVKPFDPYAHFITNFLFSFTALLFLSYVALKNQLLWRLNTTANRMVYEILPLLVFLLFYVLATAGSSKNHPPASPNTHRES